MIAKELVQGKFWLLEEEQGRRVGTLTWNDEYFMLSNGDGKHEVFNSLRDFKAFTGKPIIWNNLKITETIQNEIYGYSTKFPPHNAIFDVQRQLPLYTKSPKSRSYFCAGYYIVEFQKGWVRRDWPKLLTIMRNPYKGPFKTKMQQKVELEAANAARTS